MNLKTDDSKKEQKDRQKAEFFVLKECDVEGLELYSVFHPPANGAVFIDSAWSRKFESLEAVGDSNLSSVVQILSSIFSQFVIYHSAAREILDQMMYDS